MVPTQTDPLSVLRVFFASGAGALTWATLGVFFMSVSYGLPVPLGFLTGEPWGYPGVVAIAVAAVVAVAAVIRSPRGTTVAAGAIAVLPLAWMILIALVVHDNS